MTFLFTDIEGSTRLWEESAEMHHRVERHFEVLREAVEDVGGEVFATMGDGIAAAFSSAEAAVRTAIVAQCQLRAMDLNVRMGVHSGEAEHVGGDFRGRPLNRAARIMAVGHGGQILVSDVTAELVRSGPHPLEMSDLGIHRLRDLIHPERLWQVEHPISNETFHRFVASTRTRTTCRRKVQHGVDLDHTWRGSELRAPVPLRVESGAP